MRGTKATYSASDYSKNDPMEIDLTICFDNAYQTAGDGTLLPAADPVIPAGYSGAV